MVSIKRLMGNLTEIGEIGKSEEGGITRMAFTEEFYTAQKKLKALAELKGYSTHVDRVGNLFITYNPGDCKKYIMMGSHLDTVKNGGLYDGALGVFSALEVLDSIREDKIELNHGIIVVVFNAEEGSEMGGTFGSKTICGRNNLEDSTFPEKIGTYGLTLDDVKSSQMDFKDIEAFLELHIEQGGILDSEKLDIGVVKGIVGIGRYDVILKGTANHGGSTPMKLRDDPMKKLPAVIEKLYEVAAKYPEPFVMTLGDIEVSPGMYNIIPQEVRLFIESRDLSEDNIEEFFGEIKKFLENSGFKYEMVKSIGNSSAYLNEDIMKDIIKGVEQEGYTYKVMSSGAGHDAEEISHLIPTGMIFVPSIGGVSHSPKEYTNEEQIEKGARVLFNTLLNLDKRL
ncbi:M20 family metallo-hydrolase [Anaerosphaera multitolerans]|uniref:Zn-dependent hydrolase n=1 Tax=Anaerosphaera multitolerans TaxID=2487351 RepID=A0A437SA22_9FIRM|nr:M20 family metallo-hydrolase [Anaerosphaera multitolerans]RVU55657.1 Zn-dependent hydrolase [Anaerosphaera multitolerans]